MSCLIRLPVIIDCSMKVFGMFVGQEDEVVEAAVLAQLVEVVEEDEGVVEVDEAVVEVPHQVLIHLTPN